jgi:hypothetical protein
MSTNYSPTYRRMAVLRFTIVPDEFLGLSALIELDGADGGGGTGSAVISKARALMRGALADKLQEIGLPWAPSAEAVKKRATAEPTSGMRALMGNKKVRKYGTSVVAVAALVALWGGYVQGWNWTGFPANGQLWLWLQLLLVPVALGTIPLWIQDREYISRPRRVAYGVVIVAWTGLVIAGYLIPLKWTGFPHKTLWDWFELILLPVAVTSTMALTSSRVRSSKARSLRPYQKGLIAALSVGWIVTVIGGYLLRWSWTGYYGNTLWDWLDLLLKPLVFPTILLPALLKWVSGNAARRASEARKAPVIQMLRGLTQASLFPLSFDSTSVIPGRPATTGSGPRQRKLNQLRKFVLAAEEHIRGRYRGPERHNPPVAVLQGLQEQHPQAHPTGPAAPAAGGGAGRAAPGDSRSYQWSTRAAASRPSPSAR